MITPEEFLQRRTSRIGNQELKMKLYRGEFKSLLRDKLLLALESGMDAVYSGPHVEINAMLIELEGEFPGFKFASRQSQTQQGAVEVLIQVAKP